jgi:hypothetical protein
MSPSGMSQRDLDEWSDVKNPNNDKGLDEWSDYWNPNHDYSGGD